MTLQISAIKAMNRMSFSHEEDAISSSIQLMKDFFKSFPNIRIPDLIHSLFDPKQPELVGVNPNEVSQIREHLSLDSDHHQFYSKSIFILTFLTILNGHKQSYFDKDGTLNVTKLNEHINHLFKLNIKIDDGNNALIKDIKRFERKGFIKGLIESHIDFGSSYRLERDEIESFKFYRDVRFVDEANQRAFYPNYDGICAGLSYQEARIAKQRYLQAAHSSEIKEAQFKKLEEANRHSLDEQEDLVQKTLNIEFALQELYEFSSMYDQVLGYPSCGYSAANKADLVLKIKSHIEAMKKEKKKSDTLIISWSEHVMNMTVRVYDQTVKIRFSAPNTEAGQIVTYDMGIEKVLNKSEDFQELLEEGVDPAFQVLCYPLDQRLTDASTFQLISTSSPHA